MTTIMRLVGDNWSIKVEDGKPPFPNRQVWTLEGDTTSGHRVALELSQPELNRLARANQQDRDDSLVETFSVGSFQVGPPASRPYQLNAEVRDILDEALADPFGYERLSVLATPATDT